MKTRIITTDAQRANAINAILKLPYPYEIGVAHKLRSLGQNARYWASLEEMLDQVQQAVNKVTEGGYNQLEARRLIAKDLEPEQVAILYSPNKEVAHSVLKMINWVPSTTRLGTKEFMQYEEVMFKTMSEIVGEINAIADRMI